MLEAEETGLEDSPQQHEEHTGKSGLGPRGSHLQGPVREQCDLVIQRAARCPRGPQTACWGREGLSQTSVDKGRGSAPYKQQNPGEIRVGETISSIS